MRLNLSSVLLLTLGLLFQSCKKDEVKEDDKHPIAKVAAHVEYIDLKGYLIVSERKQNNSNVANNYTYLEIYKVEKNEIQLFNSSGIFT